MDTENSVKTVELILMSFMQTNFYYYLFLLLIITVAVRNNSFRAVFALQKVWL